MPQSVGGELLAGLEMHLRGNVAKYQNECEVA
jgi:hypothetical protein